MEVGPNINLLLQRIQSWVDAKEMLKNNEFLAQIVKMTLNVGLFLNPSSVNANATGFELRTLLKLFDVKSTHNKDKCIYFFMLKTLILKHYQTADYNAWKNVKAVIFTKEQIALLRGLVEPYKLVA